MRNRNRTLGSPPAEHVAKSRAAFQQVEQIAREGIRRVDSGQCPKARESMTDAWGMYGDGLAHAESSGTSIDHANADSHLDSLTRQFNRACVRSTDEARARRTAGRRGY